MGLGLPALAIMVGEYGLSDMRTTLLGMPVVLVWITAWMVLTSGCLGVCWLVWDRDGVEDPA
ncbi:hypothetical protein AA103196_1447 [Ameyamaea chiangmaiensis NBRC 103196]|nr:hypothetical protein AA103196_1447 [Ameyamaea chiangmaiensis NBRC 103196]